MTQEPSTHHTFFSFLNNTISGQRKATAVVAAVAKKRERQERREERVRVRVRVH
jgi:hypothetical protein